MVMDVDIYNIKLNHLNYDVNMRIYGSLEPDSELKKTIKHAIAQKFKRTLDQHFFMEFDPIPKVTTIRQNTFFNQLSMIGGILASIFIISSVLFSTYYSSRGFQ
jgi:hypothetical protein